MSEDVLNTEQTLQTQEAHNNEMKLFKGYPISAATTKHSLDVNHDNDRMFQGWGQHWSQHVVQHSTSS